MPFNTPLTYFASVGDSGTSITLQELADGIASGRWRSQVEAVRATDDKTERRKLKAQLPSVSICATFSGGHKEEHLTAYTSLMAIDIDTDPVNTASPLWPKMGEILSSIDNVLLAAHSVGGGGWFAIVPISTTDIEGHFNYLANVFEELYGIKLDKNCKDVTRLRFVTYDPSPIVNPGARPVIHTLDEYAPGVPTHQAHTSAHYDKTEGSARLQDYIKAIEDTGAQVLDSYDDWLRAGLALASDLGEDGRAFYHSLSATSPKYDQRECDAMFTRLMADSRHSVHLGTLFHLLHEAGVYPIDLHSVATDFDDFNVEEDDI